MRSYAVTGRSRRRRKTGRCRRMVITAALTASVVIVSIRIPFCLFSSEAAYTKENTDIVYRIWDDDLESAVWYAVRELQDERSEDPASAYEFDSDAEEITELYEELLAGPGAQEEKLYQIPTDFIGDMGYDDMFAEWESAMEEREEGRQEYTPYQESPLLPVYVESYAGSILNLEGLRLYVSIPQEDFVTDSEGEDYVQLTGKEKLIFLFLNEEDAGITYSVDILDRETGESTGITTGTFYVGDDHEAGDTTLATPSDATPSNATPVDASPSDASPSDAEEYDATRGSAFRFYPLVRIIDDDQELFASKARTATLDEEEAVSYISARAASVSMSQLSVKVTPPPTGGPGTAPIRAAGWFLSLCAVSLMNMLRSGKKKEMGKIHEK